MNKGTVKWFNKKKGWGFITSDEGEDLFVHYSRILGDGYKVLKQGQFVDFDIEDSEKGRMAVNVTVIPGSAAETSDAAGSAAAGE